MMYEGLIRVDPAGAYVPKLATSWEMSPDFSAFTIHLRKGVPYHRDFGEVTAQDVIT